MSDSAELPYLALSASSVNEAVILSGTLQTQDGRKVEKSPVDIPTSFDNKNWFPNDPTYTEYTDKNGAYSLSKALVAGHLLLPCLLCRDNGVSRGV
jgi:hypothetical protein